MGTGIVYELRSLAVRTDVAYHGDEARLFNSTMRDAANEIERLRLTDAEREVIAWCLGWCAGLHAKNYATLRTLLDRTKVVKE